MRLKSYLATLLFIATALTYYTHLSPWHASALNRVLELGHGMKDFRLEVLEAYVWIVLAYALLLPVYYMGTDGPSKALLLARGFLGLLRNGRSLSSDEALAGRILLLKFFFAPLMVSWLIQHIAGFASLANLPSIEHVTTISDWVKFYNLNIHARLIHLIIFVDVLLFTLGYLIEHPRLKNTFVSVDPTLSGWVVCLICYPPFNTALKAFIGWYSTDAPTVADPWLQCALNLAVLLSFGFYSWASVNLGFKASNLTNRGIVRHGVYRWIRHPAYTFKNLAWWMGAMPPLWAALQTSVLGSIAILLSLCGWTAIYVARALTEERHLLMADNGYREYMQQVRYRFIPGLV